MSKFLLPSADGDGILLKRYIQKKIVHTYVIGTFFLTGMGKKMAMEDELTFLKTRTFVCCKWRLV